MKLKTITVNDIRRLEPCYDPVTGLDEDGNVVHPGGFVPEDWTGTALDVLKIDSCPAEDRLWVVLREGWIDDTTLRLFAVWCARAALELVDEPDPRSIAACDTAERFALGAATDEELTAAWDTSRAATRTAARAADLAAAAEAAVEAAARTALAAAEAAAWATARNAARGAFAAAWAVWDATRYVAWPAAEAARTAVGPAVRKAQIERLIEMLEADDRKS